MILYGLCSLCEQRVAITEKGNSRAHAGLRRDHPIIMCPGEGRPALPSPTHSFGNPSKIVATASEAIEDAGGVMTLADLTVALGFPPRGLAPYSVADVLRRHGFVLGYARGSSPSMTDVALPGAGYVVTCQDYQIRHGGLFDTYAEAQYFAWWGHVCTAEHGFRLQSARAVL